MKKIISQNNEDSYEIRYVISKKKYADYYHNKKTNYKYLSFCKSDDEEHRNCDIGPQYRDNDLIIYVENGNLHNLYGYAWVNKKYNREQYWINNEVYVKSQFLNYVSIYNNLSYKRSY